MILYIDMIYNLYFMELDYKLIDQIPEAKGKLNYKFS
jgi:hypothetical protein